MRHTLARPMMMAFLARAPMMLCLWASLALATDGGVTSAGYLSIDSVPWAEVAVDGIKVGSTPVYKVPLSGGDHVVVLGRDGQERRLMVTIRDGFTTRLRYEPAADPPIRVWVTTTKT